MWANCGQSRALGGEFVFLRDPLIKNQAGRVLPCKQRILLGVGESTVRRVGGCIFHFNKRSNLALSVVWL